MLDDAKLEALRARYGKIGVVDYNGHQLVFRRPSRDQAREYRRKKENEAEKPDALDQLAQVIIVAFDGEEDVARARITFTTVFLEEYPMAMNHPRFMACFGCLIGLTENEEEKDMGKGVRVLSARRSTSPTV